VSDIEFAHKPVKVDERRFGKHFINIKDLNFLSFYFLFSFKTPKERP